MPYVFKPLPAGHAKAGAWVRAYYPHGADVSAVCQRMGWKHEMPSGVDVYSEGGTQLQAAPEPEPEAVVKPKVEAKFPTAKKE